MTNNTKTVICQAYARNIPEICARQIHTLIVMGVFGARHVPGLLGWIDMACSVPSISLTLPYSEGHAEP
jgi:hypothetical protein